ncbi:MAG: glyoxalase [SAR86 cluster bacterium]|uniref:Glyoxalase n=1 Tax=SAR86 cluster bacterium TaxID=2030880 RepID=A0A2A5ACH3_9GAMM|nr:MAG: glyoxalase [SAR86 cluster bacterium]
MIGYITVGTNDLEKSAKFYDELFEGIGAKRFMEMDNFIAWSNDPKAAGFSITKPFDGKEACIGNGVMIALIMDSTEKVDEMYAKAIELGATDEGAPGARSDNFYAGYFRDLDGNKLNFFCITE